MVIFSYIKGVFSSIAPAVFYSVQFYMLIYAASLFAVFSVVSGLYFHSFSLLFFVLVFCHAWTAIIHVVEDYTFSVVPRIFFVFLINIIFFKLLINLFFL